MDEIFNEQSISNAIDFLMKKKNSCGNDGVMLHDLREYVDSHQSIFVKLKNDMYVPGVALQREIQKGSGKTRRIYKFDSIDRLITKVLSNHISSITEKNLNSHCFSYRNSCSISDCCSIVKKALNDGKKYVVKIDVKDFFENINHDILKNKLNLIFDSRICNLICKYLNQPILCNHKIIYFKKGILQGNSMSPALSNLYLNEFDNYIESSITTYFYRYADDIALFFETEKEAYIAFEQCKSILNNDYQLCINERKSGIFLSSTQNYLGYTPVMLPDAKTYDLIKEDKTNDIYYNWHKTGLRAKESTYEIIENGILTSKDMDLIFDGEKSKILIPLNAIDNINIYSDISITSNILSLLNKYNITLTVFDKYGRCIGKFLPEGNSKVSKTFLNQCKLYNDEKSRFDIAYRIVYAEIFNMKSTIKYYNKKILSKRLQSSIIKSDEILMQLSSSGSINDLMLKEANAKEIYFSCFNEIISSAEFRFAKRTRRPPKDAINSLISFGNCVLYNYISNEIYKSSLNIKIGYLHAANRRCESLNLDLSEMYKPIIIDKIIFTLINKHMISEKLHFQLEDDGGIYLNSEGKRIFLKQYYKKMNSKITLNGNTFTYKKLIWDDIIEFQNYVNGIEEFKPFHYWT